MTTPTRILLVDDHSLFRESVVRLLESEPDFLVVAHCAAVTEAIRILRTKLSMLLYLTTISARNKEPSF